MIVSDSLLLITAGTTPAPIPHYMCDGAEMKIELGMTMEVGYNAYAGRMNMSLPHTEKHLKTQVREIGDPCSQLIFCYETLTYGDTF